MQFAQTQQGTKRVKLFLYKALVNMYWVAYVVCYVFSIHLVIMIWIATGGSTCAAWAGGCG